MQERASIRSMEPSRPGWQGMVLTSVCLASRLWNVSNRNSEGKDAPPPRMTKRHHELDAEQMLCKKC